MPYADTQTHLDLLDKYRVQIVISAMGNPAELIEQVHARGGIVFCDVTSVQFAEKAAAAGADGLTCIGAGGGGHSGTISHLALIPRIRQFFDGTIILAGAVASGAAIRAAESSAPTSPTWAPDSSPPRKPRRPRSTSRCWSTGRPPRCATPTPSSGVAANWLVG